MSPNKLGLFASLALAANAVLIPPSMTAAELGDDNALETLAINPFKRVVAVECPGCAVATLEGKTLNWEKDAGNAFLLDFEVGPREDSLEVAGVQLYPPTFAIASQPFYVTQINPKSEDGLRLRVTGYTFNFNTAETVSEAGVELLPMTFQITSIESAPMNPPSITINLLKDPSGRLMIASFDAKKTIEATLAEQEKECKQWPLLCKWKNIMADRIDNLKHIGKGRPGCHKRPHGMQRPHGHHNPMEEETFEGKPPHRFRPGGHHHPPHHMEHNGHHHHGHHHRMHMFLRRAFFTILVPILIGIFAGTLTYLIGMALGCLIAITVAKFRGQSYQPIALEEDVEEAIVEERSEKQEYGELPAYEAPPVYQDAPEKEVVEETK
ncbi:hypothetical protein BU25DRAFT_412401 [Macroventuria anomochaeta]|uniref:Uncharacterized protein n=1 Tax=Macroventuria anomochaeta TaxID=301207 RepID=A0ACB6RXY2_9PLEO|nr:uncharacterized protein BU25DRAFT_412401 [Macroventuria anomochaeta]KAF2625747.1 hypothetical protein BU25DRAFT_412401 [Macroventuria anomochaeta]